MVRPLVGLCCLLAFLISIVSVTAEDAKIGEWKKLEDSGVVIEYQQESEEVAKQLLPELVKQVKDVSLAGEKMPQKSTYFYPKLLTGLVLNKMD